MIKNINSIESDIRVLSLKNALALSCNNMFLPYGVGNIYEKVYESNRYLSELFYFNKNLIEKDGKILLIQAHSIYEWILLEYGIVFLIIFLYVLIKWIINNIKLAKYNKDLIYYAIFGILVSAVFVFDPFLINNLKVSLVFLLIISENLVFIERPRLNLALN